VCPTNALHRETDDAVTIAPMKCIGCQLCMVACPFGIIKFDALNKIARKCDLCVHRTAEGLEPACVTTCSARALTYGEFDELRRSVMQDHSRLLVVRSSGETGTLVRVPHTWDDPYR
jgi:formate dehydrogenase iron-sulfur subunit